MHSTEPAALYRGVQAELGESGRVWKAATNPVPLQTLPTVHPIYLQAEEAEDDLESGLMFRPYLGCTQSTASSAVSESRLKPQRSVRLSGQ